VPPGLLEVQGVLGVLCVPGVLGMQPLVL